MKILCGVGVLIRIILISAIIGFVLGFCLAQAWATSNDASEPSTGLLSSSVLHTRTSPPRPIDQTAEAVDPLANA
jgi:hypothetical protein